MVRRMAATSLSNESAALILEGSDHSTGVSEFVSLKNPAGAIWTIGNLHDTIYRHEKNVVNGWNKFYLPDIVHMQVLGVVKGTPYPCDQLVLMTCEDKKVYAYDGEELHLVASSMMQLNDEGIQYPAAKSYYKGEAFQYMTNKDWDKVQQGPVGQLLDKTHDRLVTEKRSNFLKNLRSIKQNTGTCS